MRTLTVMVGMSGLSLLLIFFIKPEFVTNPTPESRPTTPTHKSTATPSSPVRFDTAAIGKLFMVGHWSDRPVASTTALIRDYGVGGIIIMSAPEDPREIKDWIDEWQRVSSSTLLIAIDQEGGPVSRLKGPDFIATGQRDIDDNETAFAVGQTRGEELAALGINLNFAPVLDTAVNPDSFMYTRVFPTRDKSAQLAAAMIEGMATAGVHGVVKHFPGHDDTIDDSHTVLPSVAITKDGLTEFVRPFATLIETNPPHAIMTAHVAFPAIDPLPATLSPFWLTTYLRDTLQYQGVIITDDMIMDAIDQTWTHEEATVLALQAGADLILYAAEPEKIGIAIAAVTAAINDSRLSQEKLLLSLERISALKDHTQ